MHLETQFLAMFGLQMSHAEKLIRSTLPISQIIVKLNGEHPSLMLGDYNP